jgi:hypothetical protein
MKLPRSRLGLMFSSCYLIGAAVIIIESACTPADWFLCGRLLGALIVALPWTYYFLNNEGALDTMIAVSGIGIAINVALLYLCGYAVGRLWNPQKFFGA